MRELSLGITRDNLAQVHKLGIDESLDQYSSYEHKTVNITSGAFAVDLVKIDMANPNLKIITDTSLSIDCDKNCPAQSLGSFAGENNGFAGINGTYFCSSGGCEPNYYFFPVYNSTIGRFVNEDQLKYWTTGPIMAWDVNNKFYYFKDSREFIGVKEFESTYNTKLQAALGNKPRLIEDGKNLLIEWDIDEKQRNQKALRNAIAVKDNWIYLVVASNATVPELADIIKAMAVEYALNLDGGYSSALWYNDEYMVGPGRDVPNAIVFGEK